MKSLKKRLGLEGLTPQEKREKALTAVVGGVATVAFGVYVMTGDISYSPSDALKNIASGLTGGESAAAYTPYEPPQDVDGVCTVSYEGELEHLSIQGNDKGYRWTALVSPEDFTYEGFYEDEHGDTHACDYEFYQEQFEDREPQEVISQLNMVPEGEDVMYGKIWGEDRGDTVTSLHRFSGVAVRTPELSEGDSLGTGLTLVAVAHNFRCEEVDDENEEELCIRWQAHIVAAHDEEVILPPEERPLA